MYKFNLARSVIQVRPLKAGVQVPERKDIELAQTKHNFGDIKPSWKIRVEFGKDRIVFVNIANETSAATETRRPYGPSIFERLQEAEYQGVPIYRRIRALRSLLGERNEIEVSASQIASLTDDNPVVIGKWLKEMGGVEGKRTATKKAWRITRQFVDRVEEKWMTGS